MLNSQTQSNINQLLIEFSSSIDSSLIHAISSDYPESKDGLNSSRQILIGLSNQIQLEENFIKQTNITLDLNQSELNQIDKELDLNQSELNQIDKELDLNQSELNQIDKELDLNQSELNQIDKELDLNQSELNQIDKELDLWEIEQTQIDLASSKVDFESDEINPTTIDQDESNYHNLDSNEVQDLSNSNDSPIYLLKCMFPSLGLDVLENVLGSEANPIDLSIAVDKLLSLENHSIKSSNSSETSDSIKSPIKTHSSKRKNQQTKKGLQTLHLTDVMRGDERERINEIKKKIKEDGPNLTHENKWITLASQTEFLADLLKLDSSKIKFSYIKHQCNLVLAIEEILNKLVLERQLKENEEELIKFKINLQSLKLLLPNQDEDLLKKLLIVTSNEPNLTFDLIKFLNELFINEGTTIWNIFHHMPIINHQTKPETKLNQLNQEFQKVNLSNNFQSNSIHQFSESICNSKATYYRNLRDHSFRQATQSYQSSRSISNKTGLALLYAEEGRKFDLKSKFWELEAGKAKVRERSSLEIGQFNRISKSIDLHGLSRIQALAVTRDFLNHWESSNEKISSSSPLLIITGAGKHSHKSTPILLPAITRYLTRENWIWKYQHDHIGGSRGAVYVEGIIRS